VGRRGDKVKVGNMLRDYDK